MDVVNLKSVKRWLFVKFNMTAFLPSSFPPTWLFSFHLSFTQHSVAGSRLFCFHEPYYVTKILNSNAELTETSQQKGKGRAIKNMER